MASTNKTTHYQLPQWIGTDKPTFLGDLNGAFATIDTQLYTAVTNAENANDNATSAAGAVSDMQDDVNNLKTWQTTATSAISGLQSSVTQLTPTITQNKQLITSLGQYLSSFTPSLQNNNVQYRLITIGTLKLLNFFGEVAINYNGQPTVGDVTNIAQINIQNIFNEFNIATDRQFFCVGSFIFVNSDGTNTELPMLIKYQDTRAIIGCMLGINGSPQIKNSDTARIYMQGLVCLN